jgi:hypothetical protein
MVIEVEVEVTVTALVAKFPPAPPPAENALAAELAPPPAPPPPQTETVNPVAPPPSVNGLNVKDPGVEYVTVWAPEGIKNPQGI